MLSVALMMGLYCSVASVTLSSDSEPAYTISHIFTLTPVIFLHEMSCQ